MSQKADAGDTEQQMIAQNPEDFTCEIKTFHDYEHNRKTQ